MARESFSAKIKEQLRNEEIKKKCCRRIYTEILALDCPENFSAAVDKIISKCHCESCASACVRALFILFGSMTDPAKSYHLDFTVSTEDECNTIYGILSDLGLTFHKTMRADKYVLYIKDSSAIEDFLVFIGAQSAAFELMNCKIEREFRNSVNRQVNCDTANIEKQLASAQKYIEAIRYLIDSGSIDKLTPELKNTALIRMENEQLNLADLGQTVNPPVSKSGMKHRLEKILAFANEEKKREEVSHTKEA